MTAADWITAALALAALLVSLWALKYSRDSAAAAKTSAEAADRSAGAAEREEARQLEEAERRAIVWRVNRVGNAVVNLWNDGEAVAYDVVVTVDPGSAVDGINTPDGGEVHPQNSLRIGCSTGYGAGDPFIDLVWRRKPGGELQQARLTAL